MRCSPSSAVDAGKAVSHYVENQANAEINAAKNAGKRKRHGGCVPLASGVEASSSMAVAKLGGRN
jgi:hypothetical protein